MDGGQHAQPSETQKDKERDIWFKAQGYKVLRFWDNEVFINTRGVLEVIKAYIQKHPPFDPSHQGRGSTGVSTGMPEESNFIMLMRMKRAIFCDIKNCKGVTLIELIVVLAVVILMAALVAIGPGFISTDRIRSASRELLGDLQWMRHSAMTQGPDAAAPQMRGFGIRFESTNRYRLFRFNDSNLNFIYDGAGEEAPLTSGEAAPKQRDISAQLELKIKSSGNLVDPDNDVLIFDHYGISRNLNLGFLLMSVIVQNPNMSDVQKKCLSVSFNRIREGVWDGNNCQEQ